jgi:His-Xaa-Ser system protein HxsD
MHRTPPTARWSGIAVAIETLVVDLTVFDLEVVQRTAHEFTRAYVRIARVDDTHVDVTFTSRPGAVLSADLVSEFENALLDFAVRARLARETATVRDLIYRQAFVEADL